MQSEIKIEDAYPLLPAQRGFLVDSLAGEEDQYRQQICIEIKVPVTTTALTRDIHSLVARNKMLRTVFDWADGAPMQVVVEGIEPVVNAFPDIRDKNALGIVLESEKNALKPVSDAPPVRFAIIDNDNRLLLAVTYHHIILDGPSVDILLKQIINRDFLPEVPVDAYQEWLEQNVGSSEYGVWRKLLSGLKKQDGILPGVINANKVKCYQAKLDTVFYKDLLSRAKELRCTPAVYMQTLWSEWALSYFNRKSLLYGVVMSTRIPEISDLAMGPYISTVPWYTHKQNCSFDIFVQKTNDEIINIDAAKHIPLGDIAKNVSPFAINFEALLTITTRPISDNTSYKVLETYENTGYKLSADIEITNNVNIIFSVLMYGMDDALKSFIDYSKRQVRSVTKLSVSQNHEFIPEIGTAGSSNIISVEDEHKLISSIAKSLNIMRKAIDMNASFLELGGDSIAALRLRSMLKSEGLEVSVGDILQELSINELATKINIPEQRSDYTENVSKKMRENAHELFGDIVEDVTGIPLSAQAIVKAYNQGYDQDYHEQTAFRLKGLLNNTVLAEALSKLALEYSTLRLAYPPGLPGLQVLTSVPRTSFEAKKPKGWNFDEFVRNVSEENWKKPLDLVNGPLLRVVVTQERGNEWYLFMSFSALVTDGWSFATMLERFFEIYGELQAGNYTRIKIDPYIEFSRISQNRQTNDSRISRCPDKDYSSEIIGNEFTIDEHLTKKILKECKENHCTVSDVLVKLLRKTLKDKDFSELIIYENGRDAPEQFASVGPYCLLSPEVINRNGNKYAYYVFENYDRGSENRLRNGEVEYFNECGNWRRDLLPPSTTAGYVFNSDTTVINVQVLARKQQKQEKDIINVYWNELISTIRENM